MNNPIQASLTRLAVKAEDSEDVSSAADGVAVEAGRADGPGVGAVLELGGRQGENASEESGSSEKLHFDGLGLERSETGEDCLSVMRIPKTGSKGGIMDLFILELPLRKLQGRVTTSMEIKAVSKKRPSHSCPGRPCPVVSSGRLQASYFHIGLDLATLGNRAGVSQPTFGYYSAQKKEAN